MQATWYLFLKTTVAPYNAAGCITGKENEELGITDIPLAPMSLVTCSVA